MLKRMLKTFLLLLRRVSQVQRRLLSLLKMLPWIMCLFIPLLMLRDGILFTIEGWPWRES
jgi:hypothetical protein